MSGDRIWLLFRTATLKTLQMPPTALLIQSKHGPYWRHSNWRTLFNIDRCCSAKCLPHKEKRMKLTSVFVRKICFFCEWCFSRTSQASRRVDTGKLTTCPNSSATVLQELSCWRWAYRPSRGMGGPPTGCIEVRIRRCEEFGKATMRKNCRGPSSNITRWN